MLFSGYNYRSVFEQTGLNFDLNLSINNTTGSGAFGFSGEGNQIQFTFQSGKIYDFENRYVNSYLPNTSTRIAGDLENRNYSYYINDAPVCFNGIKNNFKVQRFFYNASGCQIDSSLVLKGVNEPLFSFNFPSDFKVGKTYTGQIRNDVNNLAFKIFSGQLSPTGNFSINSIDNLVSGLKTGNIKINTVNEVGGYNLTLNLYTNFGLISKNFDFTGLFELENIINLFTTPNNLSIISGIRDTLTSNFGELNYSYGVFSGNTALTGFNNLPLNIKFQYYTGNTGTYVGSIIGSGFGYNLTGTGIITNEDFGSKLFDFTGQADITGYNYTGGLYTGRFPATGKIVVPATGVFNYNVTYPGSGFMTGMAIGVFGLPYYIQYFTGGISVPNLDPNTPGTGALTGFNTTWLTGYVSGTGFIFSGVVTGADYLYLANTRSGLSTGILSGEITQYLRTGIVTFSPGSFSRIPKLATGNFQIVNSGLPINVGFSGLVFNRNNLYAAYQNLNDLGLAVNSVPTASTISANPGFLSNFNPLQIERRGLIILNSGNPNGILSNPIFNINTGEIKKIINYTNPNLTFVVGNFSFVNNTTGRWNGFLLTGVNFQLTGWDPRVRDNANPLSASINDVFLTGDNVYFGGYFDEVNLLVSPAYSALAKNKLGDSNPTTQFNFGTNKTITNLTNLENFLYIFGDFNNFFNSGNYTNTALWSNPRDIDNDQTDGYYNSLLIINPNNDRAIADPYNAHWLDYIGVTGYNQFNFNREVLNSNYTIYDVLKTTGKNYIVGNIGPIGIKRRIGVAVYDEQENLMAYNPEINSSTDNINFAFESGNIIYVGGAIDSFGGVKHDGGKDVTYGSSQKFAKLNNPFTIDRSFIPPVLEGNSNVVYDFDFYNNNVYIVGSFDSYVPKTGGSVPRSNCAIFNSSGEILTGNYEFNDYVKTVYITGFTGFFGGNFTQVTTNSTAATSRDRFAAINLITHSLLPITGNFDGVVNQIGAYTGNHILAVGEFEDVTTTAVTTFVNQIVVNGAGDPTSDGTYTRAVGGTTTFTAASSNTIYWDGANWYLNDVTLGYDTYYNTLGDPDAASLNASWDIFNGNYNVPTFTLSNSSPQLVYGAVTVNGLAFLDTRNTPDQNIRLVQNRTSSQSASNNFQGFTRFTSNNATGFYLYGMLSQDIDINNINLTARGDTTYNNSIIQLDVTGGIQTGFRPNIEGSYSNQGTIYSALASGNRVIIGGDFYYINGTGSRSMAMLNSGSALLDLNYTGYKLDNTVFSSLFYNNNIISVGQFNNFSGDKRGMRFLYHSSGTTDINNSLKFNSTIYKIKEYSGNLYVAGENIFPASIEPLNTSQQFGMIALNNASTGFFIPDQPNRKLPLVNQAILCFSTGTSGIYIGGEFTEVNNQLRTGVALINYAGEVLDWRPRISQGDQVIKSIAASGNAVYIGGNFNVINGLSLPSLAKVRADTNASSSSDVLTEFLPTVQQGVDINAFYLENNSLFLGGDFDQINNQTWRGFVQLNSTDATTINNSINFTDPNTIVNKIVKTGDVFLIGGNFEYSYLGQILKHFLPIRSNGVISNYPTGVFSDGDFQKEINDIFLGKNNEVYICGQLRKDQSANENLGGAVGLDFNSGTNTFTWSKWTPYLQNTNPQVILQSQRTNNIFIFNRFDFAGHLREGICEINNSGRLNLDFNPKIKINNSLNEYIKSAAIYNQTGIIIGGKFSKINQNGYSNFALINTNDSSATNLNIYTSNPLQNVYSTGSSNVYLGGNFIQITGSNYTQNFANFIEIPTGNTRIVTNNISFIENINSQSWSENININSINYFNNKFLIGGNFKTVTPYLLISGSGSFVSGIVYVNTILTGTGNLTLTNSSGIYRDILPYSGVNYSSTYNFSYVTNENNTINSSLNRNINEVLTVNQLTNFTGTRFYLETGSEIITGIQTLIRATGLWIVTGLFTGFLTGSILSNQYVYEEPVQTTGLLLGSGFTINTISGDSFSSNAAFTGTIQVRQSYAVASYTGAQPSGTYFSCETSNFYVTGINVTGSKIIVGNYTGLSSGLILQTDSAGNILSNQAIFTTSGGHTFVTGALGITNPFGPLVYATGIFTYSTGNILTIGYLTGIPQYIKDFSGMFNISTGIFNEASGTTYYSGLYYDKDITGYSGYLIYNTGTLFNIKIDYTPYQDYDQLVGLLTLSGTGNTIFTSLVTGI